jgi:glycerol-3-phosphate O-acyltransferase
MIPLSVKYKDTIREMMKNMAQGQEISPENVFQEANYANRPYINKMISEQVLPGSDILNADALLELHERSKEGKSCLILMEHYSNMDLPGLIYLLGRKGGDYEKAAESIVAMAGMKLNEESRFVLAFSEAYTRIVIYPSRYFDGITDPDQLQRERKKANAINRAALHKMVRAKHKGHIILVFPSGTRYRPGSPDTKRGLKEIDSYIKSFDYMVLIGIGGYVLRINPAGEMIEDLLTEDKLVYMAGPVMKCHEFREAAKARVPEGGDFKQFVVDSVMLELDKIHAEIEKS